MAQQHQTSVGNELRQGVQHAVEAVKDRFDDVKEAAREKLEGAKDAVTDAADSLGKVVKRNPLTSIGIAAGVGIVIGVLISRSRS